MHYVINEILKSERKEVMISKLLIFLVFMAFISAVVGFVVLAVWDVPVVQKVVEKPVDITAVLQKKS